MGPKGQRVWNDVQGLLRAAGVVAAATWGGSAIGQTDAEAESPPATEVAVEAPAAGLPAATVSRFRLRQLAPDGTLRPLPGAPDMPPVSVRLAMEGGVYTGVPDGAAAVIVRLDQVSSPVQFDVSGLAAVANAVAEHLRVEGSPSGARNVAFGVGFDSVVLTTAGVEDERGGDTVLTVVVRGAGVSQVRTLSFGSRFTDGDRENRPEHARIREKSPLRPGVQDGSLLRRDLLDEYVFRLNRHPGRRVDAAIAPDVSTSPDGEAAPTSQVTLDYLVSENKPWTIYAQVSNTGTEDTSEWRQRFGFSHNQLTGNDDILSLDFVTAEFDESNAFIGSYEAPLGKSDRWRWKVFGSWSEFTASDVGQQDQNFEGEGWYAGGELTWNIIQNGAWFVDLFAGARWQNVVITQLIGGTEQRGEDDFFLPVVGMRAERATDRVTTNASVSLEFNLADVAGTDEEDVNKLGRERVDTEWYAIQWDLSQAVYLEPLLFRKRFEDSNHPKSIQTLAHELVFGFRGQFAPGNNRLPPTFQQVIGGLYTVRGYKESVAAGDSVYIGSLEYRFHIPNSFSPRDPGTLFGEQFLWAPQQAFGRADWDLIFRTFFDIGKREVNDRDVGFEGHDLLMGAGVGLEFVFKRNLSLRLDYGIALKDLIDRNNPGTNEAEAGDDRLYFVGTILF